jgi:hypothetical protein
MRAYLIDEISPSDMKKISLFLKQNSSQSSLDAIFWVAIPEDLLKGIQFKHQTCRPHVFAIEMGDTWLKAELFVRSLKTMRCDCQSYSSPQQREFILNFVHHMIDTLNINT